METAFKFSPTSMVMNELKVEHLKDFFDDCCELAYVSGEQVEVRMQHDLKRRVFVVVAELQKKTFSAINKEPMKAIRALSSAIFKWVEKKRKEDETREETKRSARKKNR